MVDVWNSQWFNGIKGQNCRITYEQRGNNVLELLEYEDGERHRFEWQGDGLIRGMGFTRLGLHCLEIPSQVVKDVNDFVKTIPKGKTVTRNIP